MRKYEIIYTDKFERVNYGSSHPFNAERFRSTKILFSKLFKKQWIEPKLINEELLYKVHTKDYINTVKRLSQQGHGMLSVDTPIFKGIYEWALWYTSASVTALNLILNGLADVTFNPCGGLHHAQRDSGGGFCVFNDIALIAKIAYEKGKNVAVIDYDAHAGDGTMNILYSLPILKISVHEDPRYLYPGTGFIEQVGKGNGYGFTLNIPLPPLSGDDILIEAFSNIVIPAIKKVNPDIIILQSGVDGYYPDPLTNLKYTSHGYLQISRMLRELDKPTVILGGGGYTTNKISMLWALILSIHIDRETVITDILEKLDDKPSKSEKIVWTEYKNIEDKILNEHPLFGNN